MSKLLLVALTVILSACIDVQATVAPQDPAQNEVVLSPFPVPSNSIHMGTDFSQSITYYAPHDWDGNIKVIVENIATTTSPVVIEAYHVSRVLETTQAPKGMKAWTTTVTAVAKSYGRVKITAVPVSNPDGGTSCEVSVSDKA